MKRLAETCERLHLEQIESELGLEPVQATRAVSSNSDFEAPWSPDQPSLEAASMASTTTDSLPSLPTETIDLTLAHEHAASKAAAIEASDLHSPPGDSAAAERLKAPGKIYFSSRTHKQITQLVRELRTTSYQPKMAVLGSRSHLCLYFDATKTVDMNEAW